MDSDLHEGSISALGDQFAELSALLSSPDGAGLDPDRVVQFAVRSLPGSNHCGLTLIRPERAPRTVSATDDLPRQVDALQYDLHEGPCLDAAEGEELRISGDIGTDPRWPRFGPDCVEQTGVRSMLSVRLPLSRGDEGAMNFYSREVDAFQDEDHAAASIFAPFAALALSHSLQDHDARDFDAALSSSRQIGTAIGIIMAQQLVTSEQAFETLRSASQNLNRKLRDVAAEVEDTGVVPIPHSRERHDH